MYLKLSDLVDLVPTQFKDLPVPHSKNVYTYKRTRYPPLTFMEMTMVDKKNVMAVSGNRMSTAISLNKDGWGDRLLKFIMKDSKNISCTTICKTHNMICSRQPLSDKVPFCLQHFMLMLCGKREWPEEYKRQSDRNELIEETRKTIQQSTRYNKIHLLTQLSENELVDRTKKY